MTQTIELRRSIKRQKAQLLNDIIPSLILLLTGIGTLLSGTNKNLALANIISGGLIVIFGSKEWRGLSREHHHRIQWYDVVSGGVMMLDAAMMYKPWKGFQPADLYFVMSVFLILKGFSVIKIKKIRKLKISDEGFTLRTNLFVRLQCSWRDVENVSMDGTSLVVLTREGEKKLSLRRVENRNEVFEALLSSLKE
jgi:hypothetical protein